MQARPPRAALDRRNPAQQLFARNRSVVVTDRIASSHPSNLVWADGSLYDAVGHEPPPAMKQDNIARKCFGRIVGGNSQDIAGPNDRQHARTGDSQTQGPEGVKHLRCQLTSYGFRGYKVTSCRRSAHEVFLLEWQDAWVTCTLPQVSALASKTCSCRTAGFS